MTILVVLGTLALAALIYVIISYNLLVSSKNTVNKAWSDIQTQIKLRCDLVPSLVETVKGYAKHESDTLDRVIKARNEAVNITGGAQEHSAAENNLSGALKSLFALSENYPQLKASDNFLKLQFELTDIEDRIKASRRYYNTNVMDFNIRVEQFPGNMIAKIFNFKQADFFELSEEESAAASRAVEVKL